jgi:hypothetical protein
VSVIVILDNEEALALQGPSRDGDGVTRDLHVSDLMGHHQALYKSV